MPNDGAGPAGSGTGMGSTGTGVDVATLGWGQAVTRPGTDVAAVAGRFGSRLHATGLPVGPDTSARLAAAIGLAPPGTVEELYWLARVTLVTDRSQIEVFDRVFADVFGGAHDPAEWRGHQAAASPPAAGRGAEPAQAPSDTHRPEQPGSGSGITPRLTAAADAGDHERSGGQAVLAAASADERLRTADFASLTDMELAQLSVLMQTMALTAPARRGRRKVRAPAGRDIDLRTTLRRAERSGGDPVRLIRRRRRDRPRRLVLLCDISGSMQPYVRAYLQLLLSGVGGAAAEAFVFATRLTRLTPALRASRPDVALAKAAQAAPDWSGGTRIGDAIKAFDDRYGRRGMARRAVVIIISDGWDCGDPAVLGREMDRLRRLAHRVIWVNPRRANANFEPLTGGMAAALPYVDAMRSGHSLASLQGLLAEIREDDWPAARRR